MAEADTFDTTVRQTQEPAIGVSLSPAERVAALYKAHRFGIYRFLVGQGLDVGTAQELTQDVFVKLFVAIDRNTQIHSEQSWLYSVASKLAMDYWRREGRPMWVELDSIPALAESLPSSEPTPEAVAVRSERLRRVAFRRPPSGFPLR
jgi:RNA polymerase sigma-70 factor (ECF subfamily)